MQMRTSHPIPTDLEKHLSDMHLQAYMLLSKKTNFNRPFALLVEYVATYRASREIRIVPFQEPLTLLSLCVAWRRA